MDPWTDDATITDLASLWRRIHPEQIIFDQSLMFWRPSSAAFDDSPDTSPMSVTLAEEVVKSGRRAEDVLGGNPGFALAGFTAGLARQLGQGIARDPMPTEPAHAAVFGNNTKPVRRRFAKESEWVIPPPD